MRSAGAEGARPPDVARWSMAGPVWVLCLGVAGASLYANLSFAVTRPEDYRFFPPFRAGFDRNRNQHLGAEYWSIAQSLHAGRGYADPFREPTGPTAWMPPALPAVLAALLWACEGDSDGVMDAVLVAQAAALVLASWLVLYLARRTADRVGRWAAVAAVAVALASEFRLAFQVTHDSWLVLLALTGTVFVASCRRPLRTAATAGAWGLYGGLTAVVSPVLGLVWGVLTLADGIRDRSARRALVSAAVAVVALLPWAARNYVVFGRLVPVKSNLDYELYQSQCLEPDGVLRVDRFRQDHPYGPTAEHAAYMRLGEAAYLDEKGAQFRAAVRADPWDFARKVGHRFLAATLVYVPLDPRDEAENSWGLWVGRATHALPFLSAIFLVVSAPWSGLRREQKVVLLAYAAYLAPYVLVSYYDRYAFPLLPLKVLLVVWAADRILGLRGPADGDGTPPDPAAAGRAGGPQLHLWAAGLAVYAAAWWWCGDDLLARVFGPKFDRHGTSVVIPDFVQEWYSARLWWEGRQPYSSMRGARELLPLPPGDVGWALEWNAHPPGAVLVALPFGRLEFAAALVLWNLASIAALAWSVAAVVSRLGCRIPGWAVAPAATALVLSAPFWTQVTHGQLNLVLLPLVVGAWTADRAGRPVTAGALVGAAALIKLFPAYLLVYFAVTGRWRAAGAGAFAIAAGVIVTSAVLGFDVWPTYLRDVLPNTQHFASASSNASLPGWWLKLFDSAMPWPPFRPWPVVRSHGIAVSGALLSAGAVTALLGWRSRAVTPDRGFCAAVVAMLLVSPVTWEHAFLLLLLPIAVLWGDLRPGRARAAFVLVLAVLASSGYSQAEFLVSVLGEPLGPSGTLWDSPPWLTATVLSVHTAALCTLLGLLLFTPRYSVPAAGLMLTSAVAPHDAVGIDERKSRLVNPES